MARGFVMYEMLNLIEDEDRRQFASLMRNLRDAHDPFELPENQFRANFRLSREGGLYLLNFLTNYIEPGVRNTRIDSMRMVLCALQFMANGSYQRVVGNNIITSLSQPMVSRSIKLITTLINQHLTQIWIRFPRNNMERNDLKNGFQRQGIHDVIGLVDGTHVAIHTPYQRENVYVNRKSYHSLNVQIVCDSNLRIINVNARYPGSCHDSYIWRNSRACATMRANHANGLRDTYILGDSGYPLQPWILTPVANPAPNTPEEAYNNLFCRLRSGVERCIGLLKGRFRCLLKDRTLYYSPHSSAKIVSACAVLHNIALRYNGQDNALIAHDNLDLQPPIPLLNDYENRREGQLVRQQYIETYF